MKIVVVSSFMTLLVICCRTLRIHERLFERLTPPVIWEPRDDITLGNPRVFSALDCAYKCVSTEGCKSFLFKTTDEPQQNCYNTSTPQEYAGNISIAYDGTVCSRRWDTNNYWSKDYGDSSFPDGSVTGANWNCRDPRPDGYLWCLLSDPPNYKTCNIPRCMTSQCRIFSWDFSNSTKWYPIEDMEFFYDTGKSI